MSDLSDEERERRRAYHREYARRRRAEDPEFRAKTAATNRRIYEQKRQDPDFVERSRAANRAAAAKRRERRQSVKAGIAEIPSAIKAPHNADQLIGNRITARRRELGLAAPVVAAFLGVSRRQQWMYERGETSLKAGDLFRLSEILGVSVDEFFRDFETEQDTARLSGPGEPDTRP